MENSRTPELEPAQIKATRDVLGRRRVLEGGGSGGLGGVDVRFHAVAALLLIPTVDWQ